MIDTQLPTSPSASPLARGFAACLASVAEVPVADLPLPAGDLHQALGAWRSWLAGRRRVAACLLKRRERRRGIRAARGHLRRRSGTELGGEPGSGIGGERLDAAAAEAEAGECRVRANVHAGRIVEIRVSEHCEGLQTVGGECISVQHSKR